MTLIKALSVALISGMILVSCGSDRSDSPDSSTSGAPFVGSGTFTVNCQNTIGSGNSETNVNVDCGDRNVFGFPPEEEEE